MSDDPKPADDLREGLGLLFRAAKNLAKDITPDKTEKLISDTGGELLRVVTVVGEAVGSQLGKAAEVAEAAVDRVVDKQRAARASEAPPSPVDASSSTTGSSAHATGDGAAKGDAEQDDAEQDDAAKDAPSPPK